MIDSLLGLKLKQTQQFTQDGKRIPVTIIAAGPCWVTGVDKTSRYTNIQIGFKESKHITRPEEGHLKKAELTKKLCFLRSIRYKQNGEDIALGTELTVDKIFSVGDAIRVIGISKGKGFAGVVKRHGFAGGPKTHGQSDKERAPGSIGQTTTPGRVYKGKRMAGRMGQERVSVRGLSVVAVDAAKNLLTVKGLVPGGKNNVLVIQKE